MTKYQKKNYVKNNNTHGEKEPEKQQILWEQEKSALKINELTRNNGNEFVVQVMLNVRLNGKRLNVRENVISIC